MDSTEIKNIHADHRQRMKARFLSHGFSAFEQHEMLEMLLYYALPRKDTNAIGHKLIEHFGSISAVFDAPVEKLCEVSGVSEHTAILIKMIPALAKEYITDSNRGKENFSDYDDAGQFFVSKFIGETHEKLYAVYLDNGMHLLGCSLIGEGDVNCSNVSVRKIISEALAYDASFVMLGHNHPNGTVIPSGDDLNVTNSCDIAMNVVGIRLSEHYIVAGNKYMGIRYMRSNVQNGN